MKPNAPAASLDVAKASPDLSSETEETALAGGLSAPESKRRRLVGGAVALAPLVLTLRSGGVAAASCTGAAKIPSVKLKQNGVIPSTSVRPIQGDGCFSKVTQCATNTSKLSTDPGTYDKVGIVSVNDSGKFYCTNGKKDDVVAILSSASASSFLG